MAPPPLKKFSEPPFINKKNEGAVYVFYSPCIRALAPAGAVRRPTARKTV